MNEERWILAQLKRRLLSVKKSDRGSDLFYNYEILKMIAEIEADAVLGENVEADPTDAGAGFRYEEVE